MELEEYCYLRAVWIVDLEWVVDRFGEQET